MGVDMWAAELLLRMKEQQAYQDVELCLALPFEGYDADRTRMYNAGKRNENP